MPQPYDLGQVRWAICASCLLCTLWMIKYSVSHRAEWGLTDQSLVQIKSSLRLGSVILTSESRRVGEIFLHEETLKRNGKNKLKSGICWSDASPLPLPHPPAQPVYCIEKKSNHPSKNGTYSGFVDSLIRYVWPSIVWPSSLRRPKQLHKTADASFLWAHLIYIYTWIWLKKIKSMYLMALKSWVVPWKQQ